MRLEHHPAMWTHSAGGIFRHDQESAAERIDHTVEAFDAGMVKKAPARRGCVWAGIHVVAALTRCSGIAFRAASRGLPRPKRNRIVPIWPDNALDRRTFLRLSGAAMAGLTLGLGPLAARAATDLTKGRLKIGIIGAGRIGGTLGMLWVKAGHEVLLSSRHPEKLKGLADQLGPRARAGTPKQAAVFGQVILISVPYKALPQVGRDFRQDLAGKVVLETGNPFPGRDGDMAVGARAKGTGRASAEFLPGVRLVRAFNSVGFYSLRSEAHRDGERVAIPLAANDKGALAVAERLVREAGFEPVLVGPLSSAKTFDVGSPVFGRALTARELRGQLGIAPPAKR